MRVPDAETSYLQYKLARSGAQYDNDSWSDPEEIESWVSGLVLRPLGSPRAVFYKSGNVMSNTGEIDSEAESNPYIALDPYHGKHKEDGDYRETWIMARNVFVCFSSTGGDPGYDPVAGHGWDMDEDNFYGEDDEELGYWLRDQGDLVPTIIFKQVDP